MLKERSKNIGEITLMKGVPVIMHLSQFKVSYLIYALPGVSAVLARMFVGVENGRKVNYIGYQTGVGFGVCMDVRPQSRRGCVAVLV